MVRNKDPKRQWQGAVSKARGRQFEEQIDAAFEYYRNQGSAIIIITTNFGAEDLIRTLTPRGYGCQKIESIISRLREVSQTLTMAWDDYRSRQEE